MVGKTIFTIVPESRRQEVEDILNRVRRGERVEHFETQRVKKNGELIDVSISVSPMKDPNGNIFGAAVIARDVTMIHKMERELQETKELKIMLESVIGRELKMAELKHEVQSLKEKLEIKPNS